MTRREAFCSQVWIHSNHMVRLLTFYHVHSMVQSVRRAEFDTKQTINSQWNKHRKKKEWRNIRIVGALKEKTILDQPPVSVCLCGHFR